MSDMPPEARERMEVLLEDLHGRMDVLVDGHTLLLEKADGLGGRLDRVEGRLDRVEGGLGGVVALVRELQGETREHLAAVDGRLERIEGHLQLTGGGRGRRAARPRTAPRHPR